MARTEIRGEQITDATVGLTADVTGTLPVANGGTGLTTPGTAGRVLTSTGSVWSADLPPGGRSSIASAAQSLTATTQNLITGTSIALPTGSLKVGSKFLWNLGLIKTAAGAGSQTLYVKYGVNNTIADATVAHWVTAAATAAIDQGSYTFIMEILTLGASGTAKCVCFSTNTLTDVTGLGRAPLGPNQSFALNTNATNPYLHIDVYSASSTVMTAVGTARQLA